MFLVWFAVTGVVNMEWGRERFDSVQALEPETSSGVRHLKKLTVNILIFLTHYFNFNLRDKT